MFNQINNILQTGLRGLDQSAGAVAAVTEHQIICDGVERDYLLALPSQPASEKRALVIVLHGGAGASAKQVMGLAFPPSPLSVWREIVEREQVVVIAPNGTKMGWNDSFADISHKPETDDVGFISSLIDKAIADYAVDPARVYVIGVSKGGMMAFRLATELAPRLAAFAALLATMPVKSVCAEPIHPISALIVASVDDRLVPYAGGKFFYTPGLSVMKSVEETVQVWRRLTGIEDTPNIEQIPHRDTNDKTRITSYDWRNVAHHIRFLRVEGAGHSEPSRLKRYPQMLSAMVGAQNADIEIAEEAWTFFRDQRNQNMSC
jgi:polyhydroxybutyrate depolymerase